MVMLAATATEVSSKLATLNGLSTGPRSLSVEDATISQYEIYPQSR